MINYYPKFIQMIINILMKLKILKLIYYFLKRMLKFQKLNFLNQQIHFLISCQI